MAREAGADEGAAAAWSCPTLAALAGAQLRRCSSASCLSACSAAEPCMGMRAAVACGQPWHAGPARQATQAGAAHLGHVQGAVVDEHRLRVLGRVQRALHPPGSTPAARAWVSCLPGCGWKACLQQLPWPLLLQARHMPAAHAGVPRSHPRCARLAGTIVPRAARNCLAQPRRQCCVLHGLERGAGGVGAPAAPAPCAGGTSR